MPRPDRPSRSARTIARVTVGASSRAREPQPAARIPGRSAGGRCAPPGGRAPPRSGAATVADDSGRRAETSTAGATRSTATHRSIRSRSGPETRRRYRSGTPGGQLHARSADPSWPHGHGFIAATSVNRAGNDLAPADPDDGHAPVLERLAQRLEHVAAELGQLVAHEHALVGEGHLAGRQPRAAADHPRVRRRVVGRPDRRPPHERLDRARRRRPRRRPSPPAPPRRRGPAAAPGSSGRAASCPARAARAAAARGRRRARSRAPGARRAWPRTSARSTAGSSVRRGRRGGRVPVRSPAAVARGSGRGRRSARPRRAQQLGGLGHVAQPARPRCRPPAAPRRRPRRARRPAARPAARARGTSAGCPGPAHLAAEPELADQRHAARARPHLLRAEQDPERDREVERRARLAQLRRGEVDRDPPRRVVVAGVAQRAADPLARLGQRGVRQPHDREARQPGRDVDLDPDDPAGDPVERGGEQGREHAATLGRRAHRATCRATHPRRTAEARRPTARRPAPAARPPGRTPCRRPARSRAPSARAPSRPSRT